MADTPSLVPKAIGVAFVYGALLWAGFQRRRDTWNRRSWMLFAVSLATSFGTLAVALAMASGVDAGIYNGMSTRSRSLYFYTMLTLVLGGIAMSVGLVLSFAKGDPHRQFGLWLAQFAFGVAPPNRDLIQSDLRNQLHDQLVQQGFLLVKEENNPTTYGSWQREYVGRSKRVCLTWNSDTERFTLEDATRRKRVSAQPREVWAKGPTKFLGEVLADVGDNSSA